MNELKDKIMKRNKIEWAACTVILLSFFYIFLTESNVVNKVMAIEISISACFISLYLYFNSYRRLNSFNTVEEIVENEIKLLSTVRYWYVLPLFTGVMGINLSKLYSSIEDNSSILGQVISIVMVFIISAFVIYLNEVKGIRKLKEFL